LHLHVWQSYHNDKEVSVKVTFKLFGNHCCHPLVVQGERDSAIVNNKFGWTCHQHYTYLSWDKQAIGLLINCKQMCIKQYV
jgi:hypothetical protein